jgi:hypothetical protein
LIEQTYDRYFVSHSTVSNYFLEPALTSWKGSFKPEIFCGLALSLGTFSLFLLGVPAAGPNVTGQQEKI